MSLFCFARLTGSMLFLYYWGKILMEARHMKIALAQMSMAQDMEQNYIKTLALIKEAAGKGAELIMFPEV